MDFCIHAFISGKVQGVFYRDYTRRQAKSMRLTGWVKNLPDGRVEVIACGLHSVVMDFIEWLGQGSPQAKVSEVKWQETSLPKTFADFTIRYD